MHFRPFITEYLEATNRMLLGERTVLIMTAAIGQKSYGPYVTSSNVTG